MLNHPAVIAFKLFMIAALKKNPPRTGILANVSFSLWMARFLKPEHFKLMEMMEEELGEDVCNTWLTEVMVSSGVYKSEEPGYVEGA